MTHVAFTSIETAIKELGTVGEDSIDLSELSLLGSGEGRVIAFSLLGSAFFLTPEGEVVSVDGTEGSPETYALQDEMKKSVIKFLSWRLNFIREFGL